MATQIAFSDLNDWLTEQAENIPQTAYEIEVTGLLDSDIAPSYTEGSLGYVIKTNPTKYVDLSETELPDTIESMVDCFKGCGNLIKSPAIPSGVENLANCFYECSSLIQAPTIPHSVRNMYYCFYRCTSLTQAPSLSVNTYNLNGAFYGCTNITNVPAIPSHTGDMSKAFRECTSITTVPAIPSDVENMEEAFAECYNISYVASIPSSVLNMKNCFLNCINLERINSFTVPLATLKDNEDFQDAFKGCSSLTVIGYEPQEAQDWHIIQMSFTVSGGTSYFAATIYSRDGTTTTISIKPFTGSTVKLPVLTDELWYPEGMVGWQVLDAIDEVISTRLSYWNKDVLDPSEKHFVMKADDINNAFVNFYPVTLFTSSKEYLYSNATANANIAIDLSSVLGDNFDENKYYYECFLSVRSYDSGDHEFEVHSDLMNSSNNAAQGQPLYIQGTSNTRHCQTGGVLFAQRFIYLRNISSSESRRINLWWVKAVPKQFINLI